MSKLPDIDIDFADRTKILEHMDYVDAAIDRNGELVKHNTGVYVTNIGHNPITNMASIDHKKVEELGYIKLDLLNVHVYEDVRDEAHLEALMAKEPNWERLWTDSKFCEQVIHIGGDFKLLGEMKPDSIPRMAMFLSIIRPGKKHLQGEQWDEIAKTVWDKPDEGYYFKKSHSISYAMLVQVHMNLLEEKLTST